MTRKILLALLLTLAAAPLRAAEPALRAGIATGEPPFVMQDGHGRVSGFTVDVFKALAHRLQRPILFTVASPPDLLAGLKNGSLDVLAGPIEATPDQSSDVLLTEGYIWSEYQFATRPSQPMAALEDLKGRRLAVLAGSEYAEWADRNAARYDFTTLKYQAIGIMLQALRLDGADAVLAGSDELRYAALHFPDVVVGLALPETRIHDSAAVKKSAGDLRDELEDAMRCLKQDGTLARISKNWFGGAPGPEDLENLVVPGYGVPDLEGFDPKPRKIHC